MGKRLWTQMSGKHISMWKTSLTIRETSLTIGEMKIKTDGERDHCMRTEEIK